MKSTLLAVAAAVIIAAFAAEEQEATGTISGHITRYEADVGFRLMPELTVRAGYLTRTGYVRSIRDFCDDQLLVAVVWQKEIL